MIRNDKNRCIAAGGFSSWIIRTVMIIALTMVSVSSQAEYRDPTAKTNVNKVEPLFEENIGNYKGFEQMLESQKAASVKGAETEAGYNDLVGSKEARAKGEELSRIKPEELEGAGINESIKESWVNDYLVDYSKPGMMQHKKDAEVITLSTGAMMDGLLGLLKKLDIDCKQAKGDKQIEPQYYIQVTKELDRNKGDTVYDQFFCERLRNNYNCGDSLTLRCKTRGIAWGPWQDKQIRIPGGELVNFGRTVFWVEKTAKRCFEYKLSVQGRRKFFGHMPPDPYVVGSMREFLATKHHGATIDNISTEMSSWWEGGLFSIDGWTYGGRVLGSKDYAWSTYVVNYKYRDGKPACFEWSEEWREQCRLN